MKKICILCMTVAVLFYCSVGVIGKDFEIDNYKITEDSIGIVKIGMPLKEVRKKAKELGYTVKKNNLMYLLYDEDELPLLSFSIYNSYPKTRPVRTIRTDSSKFIFDSTINFIGSKIDQLKQFYDSLTILRVSPSLESPELISFKNWPFAESIVKDKYIIKYKVELEKITDEYGKTTFAGIYPSEFSLYTTKYLPNATIGSLTIESIEPKIKF